MQPMYVQEISISVSARKAGEIQIQIETTSQNIYGVGRFSVFEKSLDFI